MLNLEDINAVRPGKTHLMELVYTYIETKNLNFIVARGTLCNQRFQELGPKTVKACLEDYAGCSFSRVTIFNDKPSAPFMAARMDKDYGDMARVQYLIDFNTEAVEGLASPFYSKILGAFATNFFAVQPHVQRLFFPFEIQNLVGSRMKLAQGDGGTFIVRQGL